MFVVDIGEGAAFKLRDSASATIGSVFVIMPDQPVPTSDDPIQRAMDLHRSGRVREAADIYRAVLAAPKTDPNARYLLAVACLDMGGLEEARRLLTDVMREAPDFSKPAFAAYTVSQRLGGMGFAAFLLDRYGEIEAWRTKKDILVFGDSHSEYCFSGIARCAPHLVGFHTMHRIGRDGLGILDIRAQGARAGDTAVFIFGEIDVRLHIGRQKDERGRDPDAVIDDLAARYFHTLAINAARNPDVRMIVSSVVPPSERTPQEVQPKHGTLSDRVLYARHLNDRLRRLCREHGYGYLDLHSPFALEDGSMNTAFCRDTVHVNKEFHRIVALALRCTMLEMGWNADGLGPVGATNLQS